MKLQHFLIFKFVSKGTPELAFYLQTGMVAGCPQTLSQTRLLEEDEGCSVGCHLKTKLLDGTKSHIPDFYLPTAQFYLFIYFGVLNST